MSSQVQQRYMIRVRSMQIFEMHGPVLFSDIETRLYTLAGRITLLTQEQFEERAEKARKQLRQAFRDALADRRTKSGKERSDKAIAFIKPIWDQIQAEDNAAKRD